MELSYRWRHRVFAISLSVLIKVKLLIMPASG
jgi:hypothetical protein